VNLSYEHFLALFGSDSGWLLGAILICSFVKILIGSFVRNFEPVKMMKEIYGQILFTIKLSLEESSI